MYIDDGLQIACILNFDALIMYMDALLLLICTVCKYASLFVHGTLTNTCIMNELTCNLSVELFLYFLSNRLNYHNLVFDQHFRRHAHRATPWIILNEVLLSFISRA